MDLRDSFEQAAASYDQARPRYPAALFGALTRRAGLDAPAEILEVGCGTGIASVPLAEQGHRLTCLERGAGLAERARAKLDRFPRASVVNASFEDWAPPRWGAFDLVFAATAWHWLDASVRYERAQRLLRESGSLALWSATHVVPEGGDPFFAEIQEVYDAIGESLPSDHVLPRPGERPDASDEIEASGLFQVVGVDRFDWETRYDASGYLALLDTFSGHIVMEPWKRERLDGEIRRRLAERPGGTLRRHWEAVLHVARRLPDALGGAGAVPDLARRRLPRRQAPEPAARHRRGGKHARDRRGVALGDLDVRRQVAPGLPRLSSASRCTRRPACRALRASHPA